MEMKIVSYTYEQCRLAYFREQRDDLKRKLERLIRKIQRIGCEVSSHRSMELHEQASDLGMKIGFYEDAIRAFEESEKAGNGIRSHAEV